MDTNELLRIIEDHLGFAIDEEKLDVINHGSGPIQVVAGPGSGKTELITILAVKKIFVDEYNPKSVIITTFTEKGAKNLRDRILRYAGYVFAEYPGLDKKIDLSSLRIGTLHSLCADIMQEYRYEGYENYRLLDEIEQYLFVYDHSVVARDTKTKQTFRDLWANLPYLFDHFGRPYLNSSFLDKNYPTKASRTKAGIRVFNRLTEDLVDQGKLRATGGHWSLLADAYTDYHQELERHHRCDFATLQKKFVEFLESAQGRIFIEGDGTRMHPGVAFVMVDEYQDTNPIQEKIYFTLAAKTRNLCVVGDDDQALYRFRGGTVECLVTFDRACERYWGLRLNEKDKKFLVSNYRSHGNIVDYYNRYIRSFAVMGQPCARVEGKPDVVAKKSFSAKYPSVCTIHGKEPEDVAALFASLIKGMLENHLIEKPSQCVLLMFSTRETAQWAGPFANALRNVGIQPYNPRAKTYLEQEEIMGALGAFIRVVDPELKAFSGVYGSGIRKQVPKWVDSFDQLAGQYPELDNYVKRSVRAIRQVPPKGKVPATTLEILWRILSYEPFASWMDASGEQSYRLGQLTKVFESYCSVPLPNKPGTNRGSLFMSARRDCEGEISRKWLDSFYYSIISLVSSDGLGDPEHDEEIVPPDQLPIMTIHQSKGLEFDFVFVYRLNRDPGAGTAVLLEDALLPFREKPPEMKFSPEARAEQDLIRLYYVAYSRAKYVLIHLVPEKHIGPHMGFLHRDPHALQQVARELK